MTPNPDDVGLSGVAGILPRRQHDLSELAAAGLLSSSPEALAAFGFERAHLCDETCQPGEMALDAARAAMSDAGLQSHEVDVLVWASGCGFGDSELLQFGCSDPDGYVGGAQIDTDRSSAQVTLAHLSP